MQDESDYIESAERLTALPDQAGVSFVRHLIVSYIDADFEAHGEWAWGVEGSNGTTVIGGDEDLKLFMANVKAGAFGSPTI